MILIKDRGKTNHLSFRLCRRSSKICRYEREGDSSGPVLCTYVHQSKRKRRRRDRVFRTHKMISLRTFDHLLLLVSLKRSEWSLPRKLSIQSSCCSRLLGSLLSYETIGSQKKSGWHVIKVSSRSKNQSVWHFLWTKTPRGDSYNVKDCSEPEARPNIMAPFPRSTYIDRTFPKRQFTIDFLPTKKRILINDRHDETLEISS